MLEIKNLYKSYKPKKGKKNEVLKGISLKFNNSGMTFLLGKSGSGKSTLLNIIGGLDKCDSGTITIEGKSTIKFKDKDYDFYRNNYIGFVFQEFNIIEDYTVYENIVLALDLQNKKVDINEIDILLKKLEIEEFKQRKVNELSGGQKQRVAIARALIKKPKIILADEPTGNLDSTTGIQVMEVLKEISKETLVIVVSHDEEIAKKYSNRIIEIKDGVIVNDSNEISNINTSNNYSVSKTRLPLNDAFKLGFISIASKKIKLFFTILLISLSTIFLATFYNMKTYDVDDNHLNLIVNKKTDIFEISKYLYNNNEKILKRQQRNMKQDEVENICNKLNYNCNIQYILDDSENIIDFLKLDIYQSKDLFNDLQVKKNDMYTYLPTKLKIIEVEGIEDVIKENIIGKNPLKNDELIISNYLADNIIENGIYEYQTKQIFKPKSYEELINSNKKLTFGSNNYVKIVGIIEYDLSKYDILKGKYLGKDKIDYKTNDLISELRNLVNSLYNKVFTREGFINNLNVPDNITLENENKYVLQINNKKKINNDVINNETLYFDGKNLKKIDNLKENEMLISIIDIVNDVNDYIAKLENYVSKYPLQDKLDLEKRFLLEYIDIDKYINETVTLDIYEDVHILAKIDELYPSKSYKDIKIIGITGFINGESTKKSVFSKELLNEYVDKYIKIDSIYIRENNLDEIKSLIKKYPFGEQITFRSLYSNDIELYSLNITHFQPYVSIFLIPFLIFSIILICNFMFNSISSRKKDIGILKSLGAKNIDIIKIFIVEGFLLSVISTIVCLILLLFVFNIINNTIMLTSDLLISPFYLKLSISMLTFIYILIIVLISSIIPILKISKLKPIDAIYNR